LKAAINALNGIESLLTARQWERAAVVYAFTTAEMGRPKVTSSDDFPLPVARFAELGIAGLRSPTTVAGARQMWEFAMERHGCPAAVPGQAVPLPDEADWPGRQDDEGKVRYTRNDPSAFANRMAGWDESKTDAFAQDIDDATAEAIVGRLAEDRPEIVARQSHVANRHLFDRAGSEATDRLSQAHRLVEPSKVDRAIAVVHTIEVNVRVLGQMINRLDPDERAEVLESAERVHLYLGLVVDALRSGEIADEAAAFLAGE
jgi:hypothetical protein